jgi:hypothetical protein
LEDHHDRNSEELCEKKTSKADDLENLMKDLKDYKATRQFGEYESSVEENSASLDINGLDLGIHEGEADHDDLPILPINLKDKDEEEIFAVLQGPGFDNWIPVEPDFRVPERKEKCFWKIFAVIILFVVGSGIFTVIYWLRTRNNLESDAMLVPQTGKTFTEVIEENALENETETFPQNEEKHLHDDYTVVKNDNLENVYDKTFSSVDYTKSFVQKLGKVMKRVWNKKRKILQIVLPLALIGILWMFFGLGYSYVNQFYQNSSSKFTHNLDQPPKSCGVHKTSDTLKGFCLPYSITTETISGSVNHAQTPINELSQAMPDVLSTRQMNLAKNYNGEQQPVVLLSNQKVFQKDRRKPLVTRNILYCIVFIVLCYLYIAYSVARNFIIKFFNRMMRKQQKEKLPDEKEKQTRLMNDVIWKRPLDKELQELQDKQKELKDSKLQTKMIDYIMIVVILIIFVQASIQYIINEIQLLLQDCIQYILSGMRSAVFSGVRKTSLKTWVKMKTWVKGERIQENKKSKRNIIQQKNRKQHIKRSTWKQY